jgi:hypothetical protein
MTHHVGAHFRLKEQAVTTYDVPIDETALECTGEMVRDELEAVIASVHAKFPDRPRPEIETVVREAYRDLARSAVVTSHLIPLTLNRSTRMMRAIQDHHRHDGIHERAAMSGKASQNIG